MSEIEDEDAASEASTEEFGSGSGIGENSYNCDEEDEEDQNQANETNSLNAEQEFNFEDESYLQSIIVKEERSTPERGMQPNRNLRSISC